MKRKLNKEEVENRLKHIFSPFLSYLSPHTQASFYFPNNQAKEFLDVRNQTKRKFEKNKGKQETKNNHTIPPLAKVESYINKIGISSPVHHVLGFNFFPPTGDPPHVSSLFMCGEVREWEMMAMAEEEEGFIGNLSENDCGVFGFSFFVECGRHIA